MLTVFRISFAFLCFLKAVDVAWRGSSAIGVAASLSIGAIWALCAVCMALGYRTRMAAGLIIVLAATVSIASNFVLYNQHLYLIASICAILIIDRAVPQLLKAQLSIAYGFAAVTKLNEAFLSGTVLYNTAVQRPFWDKVVDFEPAPTLLIWASVVAICVEAFLAIGFWFRRLRWVALIVGLGFHLGMLVVMPDGLGSLLRLAIFGFLMIVLYIPFFEREVAGMWGKVVDRHPTRQRTSAAA